MIRDVLRFYRTANTDLAAGIVPPGSLGDYLARGGYGAAFMHDHLIPMGAAIWSTPAARMMDFPAAAFLHFCRNHGLLSLRDRPQWRTVVGGSRVYVDRMLADFDRPPRRQTPARAVRRTDRGVEVVTDRAPAETFDRVILATHADEALALLEHPTPDEQRRLGAWTYTENATVLHTDTAVLPPLPRARASWNYVREADAGGENAPATLSYDMNRLQGLRARRQYLVTLNRRSPYPPGAVIRALNYTHPAYTAAALAAQAELPALNGRDRIWFCGSYFGYGFHEDAVRSAVAVARDFDVNWPGRTAGGGA